MRRHNSGTGHPSPAAGRRSGRRSWPPAPRPRRWSGPHRQPPTPSRRPGSRPWWRRYPAHVGPVGDDRAVVRLGPAPATNPLGCQQPLPPEQAQHQFAADVHAVLATQPGPDFAVPLASERRVGQHSADQHDQVGIADRGGRAPPAPTPAEPRRAYTLERGALSTRQTTAPAAGRPWLSGPLRRRDRQPPFSAAARRISFSMVSGPTLRSAAATPDHRPTGPAAGPSAPSLPPSRKSSRQAASRWASLSLPPELARQRLEWLAAQQSEHCVHLLARRPPGPGPIVTGRLVWVLVVHRHDRHLHPAHSVSNPTRSDGESADSPSGAPSGCGHARDRGQL
jgi:hypothetical protein